MSTLNALRQALGKAVDELDTLSRSAGNARAIKGKEAEIEELDTRIRAAESAQRRAADLARPAGTQAKGWQGEQDPTKFRTLGEQLGAIMRYATTGRMDARLRAPAGMGETDPSGGGFPVQQDFATTILQRAYTLGEVLSRTYKLGITTGANGVKIPGIDESSRATGSRWGGVQSYWVGEGDAATATKPKFRAVELDLKKLMSIWYVTDELIADAPLLAQIAETAFVQEVVFMVENAIVNGTGAGQPQGILNSNALITINKDNGQATKTLSYQNLLNAWARMWIRSRDNAVWFINQDVEPQLYAVNQIIGTAGVPVYLAPNGISQKPYATLFGRPVIPIEYSPTLGTVGDVLLLDLGQYVVADKNAPQVASSVHVRFTTDEMAFRITYRVDGQSLWHTALTPFQGTNTKSPFIAIQSR